VKLTRFFPTLGADAPLLLLRVRAMKNTSFTVSMIVVRAKLQQFLNHALQPWTRRNLRVAGKEHSG